MHGRRPNSYFVMRRPLRCITLATKSDGQVDHSCFINAVAPDQHRSLMSLLQIFRVSTGVISRSHIHDTIPCSKFILENCKVASGITLGFVCRRLMGHHDGIIE